MMSESDKKETVKELVQLLALEPAYHWPFDQAIDEGFARHGFRPGQSSASVVANAVHDQSARDREAARAEAIQQLKIAAQDGFNVLAGLSHGKTIHPTTGNALAGRLRDAIAAVEREFKL